MKRIAVLALVLMAIAVSALAEEIKLSTIVPDQQIVRGKKGVVSTTNYGCADTAIPTNSLIVEGSVGIGTTSMAAPAEKLEVNGAVKVGNTGTTNPGTIRWTGTAFEGCNGTAWGPLGGGPVYVGTKHSSVTLTTNWVTKDISSVVGQRRVMAHLRFVWTGGAAMFFIVRTPGDTYETVISDPGNDEGVSQAYIRGNPLHSASLNVITDTLGRFEIKGTYYLGTGDMYILAYEPFSG